MRIPTSWKDRTLLEHPPFSDTFLERKFCVRGPSRRSQDVNWINQLAQKIQNDPKLREAAVRWAQYAFAPEDTVAETSPPSPLRVDRGIVDTLDHASLPAITLFVRFYWIWYSTGKVSSAQRVVDTERKKRGFGYRLPDIRQDEDDGSPQLKHSDASETPPTPTSSSLAPQEVIFDPAPPDVLPLAELSTATVDAGDVPATHEFASEVSSAPLGEGNRQPEQQRPSNPSNFRSPTIWGKLMDLLANPSSAWDEIVALPLPEPNTTQGSPHSVAPELAPWAEEDKTIVTFVEERDADAFIEAPLGSVQSEQGQEHEHEQAQVTDTTCSPGAAPRCMKKSQRGEKPPRLVWRNPARDASNLDRLRCLARDEYVYHQRVKRGREDDEHDDAPSASSRHRKKAKLCSMSAERDEQVTENADARVSVHAATSVLSAAPVVAAESSLPSLPPPAPLRGLDAVGLAMRDKQRGVRNPKTKTKGKKAKAVKPDTHRPAKRRLGERSETNPIADEAHACQSNVQRDSHRSSRYGDVGMSSRKRDRELLQAQTQCKDSVDTDVHGKVGHASGPKRKIAKLPQKRPSQRVSLADMRAARAPVPSASSLGIPANFPEADRMLSNAATQAIMYLGNRTPVAEMWVNDDAGLQEELTSSDDEDEYIPSSHAASSSGLYVSARETRSVRAAHDGPPSQQYATASSAPSVNSGIAQVHVDENSSEEDIPLCRAVSRLGTLTAHEKPSRRLAIALPAEGPVQPPLLPPLLVPYPKRVPRPAPQRLVARPPLTVQPPIWAKSRQEVCETLDWFNSFQSGVYTSKGIAKGYLLSAFSASRDIFARDGRLIISHGGGKAESLHSRKGQKVVYMASDQQEGDGSVRALLRTYEERRPILLLIDDRYALFPYDLTAKADCTYVVLGFYHIAHAWAERQPGSNGQGSIVRYKFAFEWCEKQHAPWWINQTPSQQSMPSPSEVAPPGRCSAVYHSCISCAKLSPLVYEAGWVCLHPDCSAFWKRWDGESPPQDLSYADSFLKSHAPFECKEEMHVDPAPAPPAIEAADGIVTSRQFAKGWHCKNCGRLSCRFKWQHWECRSCKTILQVGGKTRSPKEFWGHKSEKMLNHLVAKDSGITVSQAIAFRTAENLTNFYHIYVLPNNRGRIYLIMGSGTINAVADEIFEEYQQQAKTGELQFQRWPLRTHQCRGELLTNYFSQNTGEPYQYVGGTTDTIPFDHAPSAVVKARDLIQARMESVFKAEGRPYVFNEVLSAAYMEEQKMSFHSDAEDGLGPRVASLSLGSAAFMHFRLLRKYQNNGGPRVRALTLFLRHGDVLIMDGAEVQEYYEHTVVPLNFRIAATARYIGKQNQ